MMLDLRWQHRNYKEEDKCAFLTNILEPYNSFLHLCIHYSVQQIALVDQKHGDQRSGIYQD